MKKIIMNLHFSPLNPLKGRIAFSRNRTKLVTSTPLGGQGVMNTIKRFG